MRQHFACNELVDDKGDADVQKDAVGNTRDEDAEDNVDNLLMGIRMVGHHSALLANSMVGRHVSQELRLRMDKCPEL